MLTGLASKVRMKDFKSLGEEILGAPSGTEARAREALRSAGGSAVSKPL